MIRHVSEDDAKNNCKHRYDPRERQRRTISTCELKFNDVDAMSIDSAFMLMMSSCSFQFGFQADLGALTPETSSSKFTRLPAPTLK